MEIREVVIGERAVSLPGNVAVAKRGVPVRIVGSAAFRGRIERARGAVCAAMEAVARKISVNGFQKESG